MTRTRVADALFNKTLQRVLGLLFGSPDRGFYLREIIAHVGSGSSQVQTELARLTDASLLVRERRANQVWYRANPEASLFPELRAIALKSFGVAEPLKEALLPVAPSIVAALVFGSTAKGTATAASDIDLLIVGDVSLSALADGLDRAEAALRRTISPVIMDADEFASRRDRRDHFLAAVLRDAKVFVIGSQESLDDLVRRPPAKPRRKGRGASR